MYKTSLMIFRRDLRIQDNTALNAALAASEHVIACFILDPAQITPHPYQSKPGLQFMLQSLADLQTQFTDFRAQLLIFHASAEAVIHDLHFRYKVEAVFINRDYTPFSRHRDYKLQELCQRLQISLHSHADALLNEPEQLLKADGSAYKVFTAFYNKARLNPVSFPKALSKVNYIQGSTDLPLAKLVDFADTSRHNFQQGGRASALSILEQLTDFRDYQNERDFPALEKTSQLSAHLKFGTCSVRECYHSIIANLGPEHPLLRQLYWRDFFHHIGFHFPHVFGQPFLEQYRNLYWQNDRERFQTWATGMTGFPIVDAGMRELNNTGFMHNRVRMIVASFLVKDLHISWRWGERYFAQHLIDYDPCVNNGNWQWAASTGCDAQPYFRIFNPWLQQQKFDKDCVYIYRWIPELQDFPVDIIHSWDKKHVACVYPKPMLDHSIESALAKTYFKNCSS